MSNASAAPTVRIDAPVSRAVPAPAGGSVRSVAAALCTLLGDPLFAEGPMRPWRESLRIVAKRLAEAGVRGAIPTAEVARVGRVVRSANAIRDRRASLKNRVVELAPSLVDLAAADHTAGARLLALARGILAETRDLADSSLPPTALLPSAPSGRVERGVAGAYLVAWAATHYRPLWDEAEAVVVAALARDVGELTPVPPGSGRSDESGESAAVHAARSGAFLSVCDRLPAAAARCAARHHERFDGGGGPAGLTGEDLLPADRLLAWADRFLALLPAPEPSNEPAAAWQACWQSAAASSYAAARRGELCLTITAAGIAALGLTRGDQGETDSAGRAPVGLALTDLGRTRLRLDAGHGVAAPRFAGAAAAARQAAAVQDAGSAPADAEEAGE